MTELRKDPVVGRWVIISTERAKRPQEFTPEPVPRREGVCPLCPGSERMTPPEILGYRQGGQPNDPNWTLRVVPNKFPALRIEGELGKAADGIYDRMHGIGAHEVVIESERHDVDLFDLPEKRFEDVLWAYRDRLVDLKKDHRFKSVLIFKNHGAAAGASLTHSHSQLIALPVIPKRVMEEMNGCREYYRFRDRCLFCDIVVQEMDQKVRIVEETGEFLAFSPYAPRFPFETWIVPKRHQCAYEMIEGDQAKSARRRLPADLAPPEPRPRKSALQLHRPQRPVPGEGGGLFPLAHRDHAEADEGGGIRVGIRVLHQPDPSRGVREVPPRTSGVRPMARRWIR